MKRGLWWVGLILVVVSAAMILGDLYGHIVERKFDHMVTWAHIIPFGTLILGCAAMVPKLLETMYGVARAVRKAAPYGRRHDDDTSATHQALPRPEEDGRP